VIALFALIGICSASVFFMLAFLRAVLREARRPRARLTDLSRKAGEAEVVVSEDSRLDRAA
jgi:hypothetical protein